MIMTMAMTKGQLITRMMQSQNTPPQNLQTLVALQKQLNDVKSIADSVSQQWFKYLLNPEHLGQKNASIQKNKYHYVKQQLLNHLNEQSKENRDIVFFHIINKILASEHVEFIDVICHDEQLGPYLIKSYESSLKDWLLKALKANQYAMFEYLLSSKVLSLDMKSTKVLTLSMNSVLANSELANIVLEKNPHILFYFMDYADKHQMNIIPQINELLNKYYPEGLLWLNRKDLYVKLNENIILENSDAHNSDIELSSIAKI